ncbi:M23 family metallopeptidase [Mahella australiensis]|uniref:Peptidase M23 n=1 Tax=Mahella australiensis (strain DSM 15567 / CIP 107919 / 50-1 BON) TaxID=697281 RepID=F3ZXP4_MAHA5|nr:M23 family metallopeptidase [Mahella australiensis]AEE95551.1 Peptidase M23 [Mahella australiensis 50-1 BON]
MKRIGTWFKNTFAKDKIVHFLDKQGFYIVLFACIAIIAATAIITSDNNFLPNPEQLSLSEPAKEAQPSAPTDSVVDDAKVELKVEDVNDKETGQQTKEESPAAPAKTANIVKTAKAASAATSNATASIKLITPVPGQISVEYAKDHLVYSNTLEQWSTHDGIDITAATGTEVKAAATGKVESITKDDKLGIVITIDHGNGIKTRYGNLSTGDMVKVGQKVEAGQTISGVGNTAAFEIADAPHLHFEVIANDKPVDPKKYMK